MKPKVVPTSPAGRSQAAALEEIYKKQDALIQPTRTRIGWVFGSVLIIVAILAGLFGNVIFDWLVYHTPHWGLWQRLDVTVPTVSQTVVSQTTGSSYQTWNNALLKARGSIVTLYRAKSGETLWEQLYNPSDIAGTAIIISSDGVLVTIDSNNITGDGAFVAVTQSGESMPVQTVFDDPVSPITFLTVDAKNLTAAAFVAREQITIPQEVAQVVSATGSLAVTHVSRAASAVGFQSSEELRQTISLATPHTDASAVITTKGDFIGLTTVDGTVVPLYYVTGVLSTALTEKTVDRSYLGVHGVSLDAPGVPASLRSQADTGVILTGDADGTVPAVAADSPAATAGLKSGDIITKIDDTTVDTMTTVAQYLSTIGVGDSIVITYIRDGETLTTSATLAPLP